MKSRLLLCVSFIQIGNPSLSTPEAVLRLSKTRIAEQLQKNYQVEAAFDSDRCDKKVNYELFSEGIRISSTQGFWTRPLYLGYQELLDGQKIDFPIDLANAHELHTEDFSVSSSKQDSNVSASTKKMILWGAAIGLGAIGSWYYFHKQRNHQTTTPQIGFVRSF